VTVAAVVFFAVVVPLSVLVRRLNLISKEEAERCAFCTAEVALGTSSAPSGS